uniref:Skp1-related protein n=1 Tax=Panagrolaimus sp. JU765 TaxID=591449 RepID=A0AC34RPJ9_9BILA
MSTSEKSSKIILITNDGKEFEVKKFVVRESELLAHVVDVCKEENKIPLFEVDGPTLQKVIEFCSHYENEPSYDMPSDEDLEYSTLSKPEKWLANFFKMSNEDLTKLIFAAEYLQMDRLIDSTCYILSYRANGKTVEELREMFGIVNDFDDEKDEYLEPEYFWYIF